MAFPVDQADGVVVEGESAELFGFVLVDAAAEIAGHADVERSAGGALHYVHVVDMFFSHI